MVLITLVLGCVVVTGVNLVICEKGRDWFREIMGVKMGSRYVELPCGSSDGCVWNSSDGWSVVWYLVVGGGVILVVTLLDLKCDFSVLSLSHCVTIYSSSHFLS